MPEKEIREDDFLNMDTIMSHSQKLEEELQKLGLKIKHHEDNLKFLKAQIDGIDESILDLQVELGQYHSRALETENSIVSLEKSENRTVENILSKIEVWLRRLALLKPRLANGETPPEFIGFAVNMTDLDRMHLAYITPNGLGLRETLFYSLFSLLQVYKTRSGMQCAMPYISDGAISLDGDIMKNNGVFYLGDRAWKINITTFKGGEEIQ
ncbi:hypothetical protein ZIOFF_075064 [Zingiber officinale]|uniref:Uncharacterized protein n=1 Tax=Zingiber officinale TaxID=94328 RepID=A0A8J5BVN5_ZINOF|nr:hypothetical protein ZIOFF_075064 [Zingiber officinale]